MAVSAAKGEGGVSARPAMNNLLCETIVSRASKTPKRRQRVDFNSNQLSYTYITTAEQLEEHLPLLTDPRVGYVALDIETTGLKPWFSAVRTVQIAVEEPTPRQLVIDCFEVDPTPALKLLEDNQLAVVTCNGSFEHSHLYWHYGTRLPGLWDLCYASRELHASEEQRVKHSYAALMERHIGMAISKEEQNGQWDALTLTDAQLSYAAMDVAGALDLYRVLHRLVKNSDLEVQLGGATESAIDGAESQLEARWMAASLDCQRLLRGLRTATPAQAARLMELSRRAPLNFHDRQALAAAAA